VVKIVSIITAIALVVALGPWPYGYYQLLRVAVFLTGLYVGVMLRQSSDSTNQNFAWVLFGTALVFNPFLPVYLPREVWSVLDIVAAGVFGYTAYRQRV
jgi:hypothetical protein